MSKPWLRKNTEKVIEVMGQKITLKTLSFGENRKVIAEAMEFDPITNKAKVDPSHLGVLRSVAQIKDWDLTDEHDNKLPITIETFDNILDEKFIEELMTKISEQDDNSLSESEKKQ